MPWVMDHMWAHHYFREQTSRSMCYGCEHTDTSENKPCMPCVMGVSTLILQRQTLHAMCYGCEHTDTSENKPCVPCVMGVSTLILQRTNLACHVLWVWAHPSFREQTLRFMLWMWAHPYYLHNLDLEREACMPCVVGIGTPRLFWLRLVKKPRICHGCGLSPVFPGGSVFLHIVCCMGEGTPMAYEQAFYWNAYVYYY